MKKIIVLAIVAMIAAPSMAQKTTIQRVTREKTYQTQTRDLSVWYQGELSVGFATGGKLSYSEDGSVEKLKTDFSRPFIETVHGVRITNYAFVGLGVGLQYAYGKVEPEYDYDDPWTWNTLLLPLFVNLKGYYPVKEDFAPYLTISLGGSARLMSDWDAWEPDWEEKLGGGLFCKFGVGVNYRKFMFDFGVMHQGLVDKNIIRGREENYKMAVNSIYFNVGLKF